MLSATTVPAPVGLMAMILVAQMSLGSRGDSQANQIQAEPTRNRQRAARRQGERRVTRRQLQGAARTARSEAAAGRMRRRRTHEELQMSMGRERAHLAQVANHDHPIVRRDVVGLIVR
jgi:hypothetical protein